jgi:hypothetical protein
VTWEVGLGASEVLHVGDPEPIAQQTAGRIVRIGQGSGVGAQVRDDQSLGTGPVGGLVDLTSQVGSRELLVTIGEIAFESGLDGLGRGDVDSAFCATATNQLSFCLCPRRGGNACQSDRPGGSMVRAR